MIGFTDLVRTFGPVRALDGISLEVPPGELFGLVGPNGSGKTTLIKIALGLLRPDSGTVTIFNEEVTGHSTERMRQIGYVADEPFLYDFLSGREYLRFVAELRGLAGDEVGREIERHLGLLELADRGDSLISEYSRGMRQKVALAASFLGSPKLILLDEALNTLDPIAAHAAKESMADLCARGSAVLISTHILPVAERICDRVAIVHKGRVVRVVERDELDRARAGSAPSLEELFLELVGEEA